MPETYRLDLKSSVNAFLSTADGGIWIKKPFNLNQGKVCKGR